MARQTVQFEMITNMAVDVMDKGAIADGVNDDTAEINAALTAGAGGVVFFPAGTYKISDSLVVPSNTTIVMDPSAAINVAASAFIADDAVFKIDKKDRITIHGNGATITGQREGTGTSLISYGVDISGSTNIRVYDLNCVDFGGDGFMVQESDDDTVYYSENVWIERCRAYNCMRNGFTLVSGKNVWFSECIASTTNGKAPQTGYYVEPNGGTSQVFNVVFRDCVATMNTSAQFQTVLGNSSTVITSDVDLVFDNCRAIDCTTSGMRGFDVNSHKSTMPNDGRVLLVNCTAQNISSYGLCLRHLDKAGQNVTVKNFHALDCNTQQATGYGGNAPVTIHASNSASWPNPGGIRIDGLRIVDNTADRSPYYINSDGTAWDDIHILNLEWVNSVGTTTYPFMDDATTDTLVTWVPGPYSINKSSDYTLSARHNGWIMDNKSSGGTVTFTLPAVAAGLVFYFEVYAAFTLRIDPNASDKLTPYASADGYYMQSSTVGSTAVIYANRDADNWVVERAGTWTDE